MANAVILGRDTLECVYCADDKPGTPLIIQPNALTPTLKCERCHEEWQWYCGYWEKIGC